MKEKVQIQLIKNNFAMACFCTFTIDVLDPDSYLYERIWIQLC